MKQPHAFITGIAGFAGSFLAEELLNNGYKVTGSILGRESTRNISAVKKDLNLVKLDVSKPNECSRRLKQIKPNLIFHLAAFSSVGQSYMNERITFKINFDGTLNMLNSTLELNSPVKFLFVSSADCYGKFKPAGKTLTEEQPFNPISPYAVAKAAAEFACKLYFYQHQLPIFIARSFNHTGPRQSENFVVSSFARQIAQIEKNKGATAIHVGDLTAKRDFSDVRDIVRGYRLIAEKGTAGETYQLCSGKAVSIKNILELLLKLSDQRIAVKTDTERLRKNDIPCLKGDFKKARNKLGFRPKFSLTNTLKDTLDYWRKELQ